MYIVCIVRMYLDILLFNNFITFSITFYMLSIVPIFSNIQVMAKLQYPIVKITEVQQWQWTFLLYISRSISCVEYT